MKIILWIVFIFLLFVMRYQGSILSASGAGIVSLEFANQIVGIEILQSWANIQYGDINLLQLATINTKWDFAFIISYVILVITMSNWQMQREHWFPLNELLRLNLFTMSIAGILDIIENFRLLHNFHHIHSSADYWSTQYIASIKFILVGFSILIFLTSWIKSHLVK